MVPGRLILLVKWSEHFIEFMPAKDRYHNTVVVALTAGGWQITDDPLYLNYGDRKFWVDLGAEQETLAAEKHGVKIAVEIKSFLSNSPMDDLEKALGQYNLYRDILEEHEPERQLYLAVAERVYDEVFADRLGQLVVRKQRLLLLVFDEEKERIIQWIPMPDTGK